uniref:BRASSINOSTEROID INSENSITIVE 1-associated receptor kinase 1 n=1 Tax=Rhizophora mucronata TaxID=61149 RepID=A0A2P2LXX5_RHIMU
MKRHPCLKSCIHSYCLAFITLCIIPIQVAYARFSKHIIGIQYLISYLLVIFLAYYIRI